MNDIPVTLNCSNHLTSKTVTNCTNLKPVLTESFVIKGKDNFQNSPHPDNNDSSSQSDLENSKFDDKSKCPKRVSAFSKVNFSKLSHQEKQERFTNLKRFIRRLEKKVNSFERKFQYDPQELLNSYITHRAGLKKGAESKNFELNINKLCKAFELLNGNKEFEYEDQRHVIENLANVIAEGSLKLNSINFLKICTQLRRFLAQRQKVSNPSEKKTTFSFPEEEISISKKEYNSYSKYKHRDDIIRAIFGIVSQKANGESQTATNVSNTHQCVLAHTSQGNQLPPSVMPGINPVQLLMDYLTMIHGMNTLPLMPCLMPLYNPQSPQMMVHPSSYLSLFPANPMLGINNYSNVHK